MFGWENLTVTPHLLLSKFKFFLKVTAQCDANEVRHSNVHLTVLSLFYSKLEPFYSDCLFCSKLEPS